MTPHFDRLYKLFIESPDTDVHYKIPIFLDDDEELDERFYELYGKKPYDKFGDLLVYYSKTMSNMHEYSFIDVDKKLFVAEVVVDNNMTTDSIWKHKDYRKDLMKEIYLSYFLPHTKYIQSTTRQSVDGVNFWKKLIRFCLDNEYKCSYIEKDSNEEYVFVDVKDFDDLTSFIWNNSNVILRIYSKND